METRSEPVTKSWRSDRCENPQERRDTEAEKMKQAGWTVEPYSAEITGRQGCYRRKSCKSPPPSGAARVALTGIII